MGLLGPVASGPTGCAHCLPMRRQRPWPALTSKELGKSGNSVALACLPDADDASFAMHKRHKTLVDRRRRWPGCVQRAMAPPTLPVASRNQACHARKGSSSPADTGQ